MSLTAPEIFYRCIVVNNIKKLLARPFPIQEVRFWLTKVNELSEGGKITWQEPHMNNDTLKELLQRSYRSHLLDIRRMRQLLAETLGENLDRKLCIEDVEVLQFIVDEIKMDNVSETELYCKVSDLEDIIYFIYNGHSRNEDPSVLALTG